MKPYCARPNRQHHLSGPSPKGPTLRREFDPAIADFGFRAPLLPHLARQYYRLFAFENYAHPAIDSQGLSDLVCLKMQIRPGIMPVRICLAERVGFEPTVESPLHCISSAACSSTPAPLPIVNMAGFGGKRSSVNLLPRSGGEGGIRTHGAHKRPTVFETATFNHSVTSPLAISPCPAAPEKILE